ncbi:MAG: hypothetical protein P3X24_005660, partial [bacterium]|nr:hypothetical protein [bacterium]
MASHQRNCGLDILVQALFVGRDAPWLGDSCPSVVCRRGRPVAWTFLSKRCLSVGTPRGLDILVQELFVGGDAETTLRTDRN